jgi:hypothetical protein
VGNSYVGVHHWRGEMLIHCHPKVAPAPAADAIDVDEPDGG